LTAMCRRVPCDSASGYPTACPAIPGCTYDTDVFYCHDIGGEIPCSALWRQSRCEGESGRCEWSGSSCGPVAAPPAPPPCRSFDGSGASACPTPRCSYDSAASLCIPSDEVLSCSAYVSASTCPTVGTEFSAVPAVAADGGALCRRLSNPSCAFPFFQAPATPTSDRACALATVCNASQYEAAPPTATTDRVCVVARTQCDGPGDTEVGEAALIGAWQGSQSYLAAPATPTSDIVCEWYTDCGMDMYEVTAPTPTSDRACVAMTTCLAPSQFVASAGTATTDRVCRSVTVCTQNQYQAVQPTSVSDRVCAPLTTCLPGWPQQYQIEPQRVDGIALTDRGCGAISVCQSEQYEQAPPTPTSNRVCLYFTECVPEEFELVLPTRTTDRVCATPTSCEAGVNFELIAPTTTSDRVCVAVRSCGSDQYETVPSTPTTDRVCALLSTCGPNQFQCVVVYGPAVAVKVARVLGP
jgi:hypothetical protein